MNTGEGLRIMEAVGKSGLLTSTESRAVAIDLLMHVVRAPALGPRPFQPAPNITAGCMDEVVRFFQKEIGWEVRCEVNDGRPMVKFNSESPRLHYPVTFH